MVRVIVVLVLGWVVGCSRDNIEKKEPIPLDQVPSHVLEIAKRELPDVTFERAMKKANGEYEVIGKDRKGKVREIDITADGKVTEIE